MPNTLSAGDLAIVIPGNGPNNVRQKPDIKSPLVKATKEESQIPEHAVLAVLPCPAGWTGTYPHDDGVQLWWYVRGRTENKLAADRFEVIEGLTAASQKGHALMLKMDTAVACRDTMRTTLDTHRQAVYGITPPRWNHAGCGNRLVQQHQPLHMCVAA